MSEGRNGPGRPHRRADPSQGPVEALAHALDEARGGRTFESMSRQLSRAGTPVAVATLSAAARGQRLPTWATVEAFARACGQDPAAWRTRWEQAADTRGRAPRPTPASSPATPPPVDGPPAEHPAAAAQAPVRARRARLWAAIGAGGAAVAVAAVLAAGLGTGTHGTAHAKTPATHQAPPHASTPASAPAATAAPDARRRAGPLVLPAGQVADLDSLAPDWHQESAPGSAVADIEFTSTYHSLTGGQGDSNLGILPPGSTGTRKECSLLQNTGIVVHTAQIRPGLMICALTNDHHIALLRITDVHQAGAQPDTITFQVIVWTKPHHD